MKSGILISLVNILLILCLYSCKRGASSDKNLISSDTAIIAIGKNSFTKNCSGCHGFRQNGIGPRLDGITQDLTVDWIHHFIKDPKQMIESGDERALVMFKKYRTMMPLFSSMKDEEINAIIAFINTHKRKVSKTVVGDSKYLIDPIPDSIRLSDLVVNIKLITQFPASSDSGKLPLTRITKLDHQPKTGSSFVLDLRGKLYKLQTDQPVVYMDMAKLRPKFINVPGLATGFGSFAFHPDFAKNGIIYTTHTEPAGTAKADFDYSDSIKVALQWVVMEWKTDNPNAFPFSGKGRELFRVDMVQGIHGVEEIAFNPFSKPGNKDYGLLYICVGDGGSVEDGFAFLSHSLEKIWGTILRIDPAGRNSTNQQYGIPLDNPFVKDQNPKMLKEIYAYGFRNPHRISWTHSGQMLAGNVGLTNVESLYIIEAGNDYGWPVREGGFLLYPDGDLNKVFPLSPNDSIYHITYPVAQYDHDEGRAISAGFEYQGKDVPQLIGKYLFGDIYTGRLFYVEMADLKQGSYATIKEWKVSINGISKTLKELCGTNRVDLHFGKDAKGELYILTKPDGKMYKLAHAIN